MGRRKRSREVEEFDMAPMIDMVFLLLVFFMTVSTMAQDSRPELELAETFTAKAGPDEVAGGILTLQAEQAGELYYYLGAKRVLWEELRGFLEADPARREEDWVIRANRALEWKQTAKVLELFQKVGIEQVRFAAFEQ